MKETENISIHTKSIEILEDGSIGVEFCSSVDNCALAVRELLPEGLAKAADTENQIQVGDILISINGNKIIEGDGPWIQKSYESLHRDGLSRPLRLEFIRPYFFKVIIKNENCDLDNDGPEELLLKERISHNGSKRICLDGFHGVDGSAESSGILIGDNLIFINGIPVGAGIALRPDSRNVSFKEVQEMLADEKSYPLCLHFARQISSTKRSADSDLQSDDIKTIAVTTMRLNQLGCAISKVGLRGNKFVANQFHAVSGNFNRIISDSIPTDSIKGISFHSINGELIPSYASCDMVQNAMKRGWKSGQLEIIFCDDKVKGQLTRKEELPQDAP